MAKLIRVVQPPRSLLGEVDDAERAKERMRELARGAPLRKPSMGRLTLEEAVDVLSGGSSSEATRDRKRRRILQAIKEGKVRLPAASIEALAAGDSKREGQRNRRERLRLNAMAIWQRNRTLSVSEVARRLKACDEFAAMGERAIRRLIEGLHPKHF